MQLVVCGLAHHQAWLEYRGEPSDLKVAKGLVYLSLAIAALMIAFYVWSYWKSTCGWEEVYVCVVERE
jgi:hypothetical protein